MCRQVGLVVFSTRVIYTIDRTASTSASSFITALHTNVPHLSEGTYTNEGLRVMREQCFADRRPDALQFSITLTDGVPTLWAQADTEAEGVKARAENIETLVFSIGPDASLDQMVKIAGDAAHVIQADSMDVLHTKMTDLVNSVCQGTY